MKGPSYSRPEAISFDGAHWSPSPWVPGAHATRGLGPVPAHAALGTMSWPVTATGVPNVSVVRYIIRVTVALTLVTLSGST